ncbi:hypothetical protein ABK040_008085 [Willaertia magna]
MISNQDFDTDTHSIDLRTSLAEEIDREFFPIIERVNVPKELLEKTILNNGCNCWDLSLHHRLSLSFIKFFGCPFCQQVVEDLQKHFTSFLKCNTIPIICHQEDSEKAFYLLQGTNLLHSSVNHEILKGFQVREKSILSHLKMMPKICKCLMEDKTKEFFLPSLREMQKMKLFTMFEFYQVYKGEVWAFRLQEMGVRPNYGKMLMELGSIDPLVQLNDINNGSVNLDYLSHPEVFLPRLIRLFPQFKEKVREERLQRNEMLLKKAARELKLSSEKRISTALHMSLDEVLQHNLSKRMFKAFLVNIRQGIEELMFLEEIYLLKTACEVYQSRLQNSTVTIDNNVKDITKLDKVDKEFNEIIKKVKDIFETFFGEDSLFLLSYNKDMSEIIMECINKFNNNNDLTMEDCSNRLDVLSIIIKQQILTPLFKVYIKTKIYQDMLQEVKLLDLSNFL